MISPKKHNHPDKTLVYTSYLILDKLRKERVLDYDVLLKYVKKNVTSGEFLFMPSLNFLYLLGLIEYKTRTDSIEYIEKKYENI
ncbi:ABC-three component system middle component 8 [uncultured Psychrobacter sp.]|uniref:ABC-three component system middle component 8 n=1 Tax=uncultured Psychrobacter sp. TaxID=259303 RepID=UPI00345B20FF